MADPITLAAIAVVAGGTLQAFSAIQQGRIAEAQGKFAKEIAVRNAQALERQAKAEGVASRFEERRIAKREKIVKAAQRAAQGVSGGQIAGATLEALADIAFEFSLERNLALRTGVVRGRQLRERGQIELAKGRFARTQGIFAKRASFISAGGSIFSAASSVLSPSGSSKQIR